MNSQSPTLAKKLFQWYCNPALQEQILGDLEEQFEEDVQSFGRAKAKRKFWWNVIRFMRRGILRDMSGTQKLNHYGMLKNYFKITRRTVWKQKLYSSINIGGLITGITVFMLIFMYVDHEQSYDRHYENSENIFNILLKQKTNVSFGTDLYGVSPAALPSTLVEKYPEVVSATSLRIYNTLLLSESERYVEDVLFTDEHYFDVFKHNFITGNPSSALFDKTGAVLTESMARKLFGSQDPIGKKITFWGTIEAFVTGIIEDVPSNTTMQFSCILSLQNSDYYIRERAKTAWNGNSYYTFFQLDEKANASVFEDKIQQIVKDHWIHTDIPSEYLLSGLTDLHLRDKVNFDIGIKGNSRQMKVFSIIAIVVLLLACINYMNLSIALSVKRAKEVGLRKAMGAKKKQLITQFLLESLTIAFFSFVFSYLLVQIVLPLFGELVERKLDPSLTVQYDLLLILISSVVLVGIVAGSYPAFFMTSFRPSQVLKGKIRMGANGGPLQKGLVILQYTVSIVMMTFSLIVYLQMRFVNEKKLGFQKDQIIVYEFRGGIKQDNVDIIGNQFSQNPMTSHFTFSSSLPINVNSSTFLNDDKTGGNIYRLYVDANFLDTYEIELLEGRFLNERDTEEDLNYVLNETAAQALGWTAKTAIGKILVNDGGERKNIVGVVKDFHMHSLHLPIAPLMMGIADYKAYISVKVRPENIRETISYMEQVLQPFTSYPFEFQFLDDHFNQLYEADQKQAQMFSVFTFLAVLVASLGLFGLAALTVSQRTKEIGIRKVLGATIKDTMVIFSTRFLLLVAIAFLAAIPVSWYLANSWLDKFSYRIVIEWWMFLVAGACAIILAFSTISSQSLKASLINPVESLKDE